MSDNITIYKLFIVSKKGYIVGGKYLNNLSIYVYKISILINFRLFVNNRTKWNVLVNKSNQHNNNIV